MRLTLFGTAIVFSACAVAASQPAAPVVVHVAAPVTYHWTDRSYSPWDAKAFRALSRRVIDPDHVDEAALSAAIFQATNAVRQSHGLPALAYLPACRIAAQRYSDDMVRLNFFDANHGHPNPALATPRARMTAAGVQHAWAWGENIAIAFGLQYKSGEPFIVPEAPGQPFLDQNNHPIPAHTYASFAAAVLAQWMASPHHRANILDPEWTHFGAACTAYREEGFPKLKCTQDFVRIGSPAQ